MNFFKGNFKFIIILLLVFFGGAIINIVDNFDYNENKTGIIYQENENVVLSELNRSYNYNINYDLEQSYLQYVPVKKNGLLDNYHKYTSKNLAVPNLIGKEYLGNGEYSIDNYFTYNIYSGLYTLNKNDDYAGYVNIGFIDNTLGDITIQGWVINGVNQSQLDIMIRDPNNPYIVLGGTIGYNITSKILTTETIISFYLDSVDTFNNFQFKVQIEQGTTATPYTVPYIPAFKIDFKGSNQVEYINPYEEQIIKINDINNVNNIEFELLNVINPVVFNWNITTNPNIPFVKFYNNKTKLLYDFTDIREINNIGNELMGSRSNFSVVFGGVFELIDMFYSGFQKLFNNSVIRNILDNLKVVPSIVGKWFWFKGGIN